MTVNDLIDFLLELPPNLEVFIAKDAEGNGFNPAGTAQLDKMDDNNEVYAEEDYFSYEDDLHDVVVIWP